MGHVDGLLCEPAHESLHGHGRQDIAAELDVPASPGEAEGLDEVPLGDLVLADVEGRPAGEAGELGGDGEQLAADLVGERSLQQRGGPVFQAGGDGVGPPVPAAVFGVPAAGLIGGVSQFVQIKAADLRQAAVMGGAVGGGDEPAGDGGGARGEREARSGQEVAAVHTAPERSGDADGIGGPVT
ncbi:hypothetical protein ACFP1Z_22955 [Streptomyces gamaensis]|uniref:Uncharacterized protein n=1 Tax=Streptomyces gamaensis TaxID=1763542 RepID=A0ABW0Z6T4_9ACTN